MQLRWKGAASRYLVVVWFSRFDRIGKTAFESVAFLTFFVSMLSAAPFVYFYSKGVLGSLDDPMTWVFYVCFLLVAMVLLQNLMWVFFRFVLYLLEEL